MGSNSQKSQDNILEIGRDSVEILRHLIRINTTNPPGNEKRAAEWIRDLLQPHGFRCRVQDIGNNRANLIATLGEGKPELMLNGHLDVVPATGEWTNDPFDSFDDGDLLYGRGAADMKSGVAAMCAAAIQVADQHLPMHGTLRLVFVADEECSNEGTKAYLKSYDPADYALIGEPTKLEICVAHRGVSRDYIDIIDEPRHAALPASEDSVSKMVAVISLIEDYNRKLKAVQHPILPPPSISITMVEGYEKDNTVPGKIRLLLDYRILPHTSHEQIVSGLKQMFENAGYSDYKIVPHFYMPGGEINPSDAFVKMCLDIKREVVAPDDPVLAHAFDASCEQCFYSENGVKTIVCGPGDLSQAHTIDEHVSKTQVRMAEQYYFQVICRLLGVEKQVS